MNAFHCSRATQLVAGFALLTATATALMMSTRPVLAFTCEDVRGMSKAQQDYWSKQLNLTPDQRHRIWLECYSQARVTEPKGVSIKSAANQQ